MTRSTIDLGIDLGTTNSACAVFSGTTADVVRNNDNHECTPSAVWLRGAGRPASVGDVAYQRATDTPQDVAVRAKLLMGTAQRIRFEQAGLSLLPEEVSAEVLKSLKGDAQQRIGEEMPGAVITVPAAFTLPQREATKKAASLAGFTECTLLQEPVAAGLAYGFNQGTSRHTWLVYDLGGGTFDAAILRAHDGSLKVLEHGGDEHLGGGKLDRLIVDELLVPALLDEFDLPNFSRDTARWRTAYARLTREAERAKIRLSRVPEDDVTIEFAQDGHDVFFEYTMTRADVQRLAEGIVNDTIRTCKRVMAQAGLGRDEVERVLLVGGPTLMPYIRERLKDPVEGLGIPLAFDVDPMTAVARGAALHAGSLPRTHGRAHAVTSGTYRLTWTRYQPVGATTRPNVSGRIEVPAGAPLSGAMLEITRDDVARPWRTRVIVDAAGNFEAELFAEKDGQNRFRLSLVDGRQVTRSVEPSEFTYAVGLVSAAQRANHPIGIATADNRVDVVVERGTELPFTRRITHELAIDIPARGQVDLKIPLVEGDDTERADRNRPIGEICLPGRRIPVDLDEGTAVQIDVTIDGSGTLTATAQIGGIAAPISYENATVVTVQKAGDLRTALSAERARIEEVRERADEHFVEEADEHLERAEALVDEVESTLASGEKDAAIRLEAENRLLTLRRTLDQADRTAMWPAALEAAEEARSKADEIVYPEGTVAEEGEFEALSESLDTAIATHDLGEVKRLTEGLESLERQIRWRRPSTWAGMLSWLEEQQWRMSDRRLAGLFLQLGQLAIQTDNFDELRRACLGLFKMLPDNEQPDGFPDGLGGVTRRRGA